MRLRTSLVPIVMLLLAADLSAQIGDVGDIRAFVALRATHIGALTPLMTPAMISRRLNGAQLGVRYGFREEFTTSTQAIAASGIFSIGMASSVSLTAGVSDAECADCSPAMMLGVGGDMRIYESGGVAGAPSISLALSGDFGYAQLKPGDEYALGLGIGAPFTLGFGASPQGGMRFAPFVTPMFGVGSTSGGCGGIGDCEDSGIRWMLGGGIGVWNPLTSISASLGVNHVFFENSRPVFGVNVQIGGK